MRGAVHPCVPRGGSGGHPFEQGVNGAVRTRAPLVHGTSSASLAPGTSGAPLVHGTSGALLVHGTSGSSLVHGTSGASLVHAVCKYPEAGAGGRAGCGPGGAGATFGPPPSATRRVRDFLLRAGLGGVVRPFRLVSTGIVVRPFRLVSTGIVDMAGSAGQGSWTILVQVPLRAPAPDKLWKQIYPRCPLSDKRLSEGVKSSSAAWGWRVCGKEGRGVCLKGPGMRSSRVDADTSPGKASCLACSFQSGCVRRRPLCASVSLCPPSVDLHGTNPLRLP